MKKYTNNEIKENIRFGIHDMTPNVLDRVQHSNQEIQYEEIVMKPTLKKTAKIITTCAACAALLGLVCTGAFYDINYSLESMISIDVNPSIEIEANKKDRVIKVNALNQDAEIVLDDMDLKNTDIDVAINAIMGSMVKNGYLSADKNSVLITVSNNDEEKRNILKDKISKDIQDLLDENDIIANIYNQKVNQLDKEIEKMAKQYNISYGKMLLIDSIVSVNSNYKIDTLAKMSLEDIEDLLEDMDIDIDTVSQSNGDVEISEVISYGKQVCGDCGRLEMVCRNTCNKTDSKDSVDNKVTTPTTTGPNTTTNNKPNKDICDDCGRLESVCKDTCDDCGRLESVCKDTCDDKDDAQDICDDCGRLESVCKDTCDDKDDAQDICDDCGRLESVCKDTCDDKDDAQDVCDDCGRLESVCKDSCDSDDEDENDDD